MLIDLPDGRPALDFNQDSPRRFSLPPETTRVRLSLGILAADLPVRFRAFVAADGEAPLDPLDPLSPPWDPDPPDADAGCEPPCADAVPRYGSRGWTRV